MIERFAGRFALLRHLGRGGMGDVYLARDLSTGSECALKRLHHGASRETAAQMEAEFRLLTRVSHPAVVSVFELGFSSEGRPFFTMEYVPGLPADRAIRRDDREAFAFAAVQLALGLEALHAAGIVHGDLKPSNLLVLPGPNPTAPPAGVRLLDFGLARMQHEASLHHSGTAGYAAPEVVRGELPTPASDLYGLGATLFHLASGQRPFDAASVSAVLRLQQAGPPGSAPLDDAGAPAALQRLILRLMSPVPGERGDGATEIRRELERLFPSAIRPLAERLGAGRLVGRERELARLESWLAERDTRVRLQIVTGGEGAGASAMLAELAARAGIRHRRVIRLEGSLPPGAAARVLLRRLLADAEAAGRTAPPQSGRLAEWLASEDTTLQDDDLTTLVEAATTCLAPESAAEATLVLVDDSQLLGPVTRALLRRLLLAPVGNGCLRRMVWARRGTRESLSEDERALCDAGRADVLELGALSRDDVARLASARLGSAAPPALVDWLWARAAGHAGFTIELLRQAATAGAISEDEVGLRVAANELEALAAPATLEAALIARWQAMNAPERAALAALAAWGRMVAPADLIGVEPRAEGPVIERLVAAGLIARDEDGALALRPPALAPALLSRLDGPVRAALHEAVLRTGRLTASERFHHLRALGRGAEALAAAEVAFAARPDERFALAAAALCEAEAPAEAARWCERGARVLFDRARHAESIALFDRALALDPDGESRHDRRAMLAHALFRAGSIARLEALLPQALGDAPPPSARAQLLVAGASLMMSHGRYAAAEVDLRTALALCEREADDVEAGFVTMTLAFVLLRLRRHEEAEAMAGRAVEAHRRAGNARGALRAQGELAAIALNAGRYDEAQLRFASALKAARAQRERFVVEELLGQRATLWVELGRWRAAREDATEALQLALEDGRAGGAAVMMTTRALLEGLTGRARAARVHARAAHRMARTTYPAMRATALRALALARRISGRLRLAERAVRRSLSLPVAPADERDWGRTELATILLQSGRTEEARALLHGEEELQPVASAAAAALAIVTGRSALRLGELDAAERLLASAEAWRNQRPLTYFVALAAQLRAELALGRGRTTDGAAAARQTLEAFATLPAPADRAQAALEFARLAYGEEGDERAPVSRWLEEAAAGFQRLGDLRGRERALALLVRRLKRLRVPSEGAAGRAHDLITAVRRLLDSLSDLRELAQRAMQLVVEQLDAERGVLLLVDDKTGRLVEMAEHGAVDAATRKSAVGYSRRVVERVAESGGVVLIGDAASEPGSVSESILNLHLQSILCVPMYVGGHVVGAVYLDDSRRTGVFSEADRALLEGFAQLMAVAFEKSRGQQEVERVNRQLVGENIQLRMQAGVRFRPQNLVAISSEMHRVMAVVERVAHSDATVLARPERTAPARS